MECILHTHAFVPVSAVDLDRVYEDLTIQNEAAQKAKSFGFGRNARTSVCLAEEHDGWLSLPRGYASHVPFRPGVRPVWRKAPELDTSVGPWFLRRPLWEAQHAPFAALCRTEGDKLLCLGCGKGKTSLALTYAATRRKRTLVIVDRDFLVDQWTKEAWAVLGVPAGRVQGKVEDIGRHVTIAMIHTLAQKDFPEEFYDQFGLIIVDEAHTMAAETFRTVIPKFIGERLLLSATPERQDMLHPLFLWHAGGLKPCYVDVSRDETSEWYFAKLPPLLTNKQLASMMRPLPGMLRWERVNGKRKQVPVMALVRSKYDTAVSEHSTFQRLVLKYVRSMSAAGRNILVLGLRTAQLAKLHEKCVAEGIDSGLVIGRVKPGERLEALERQVIFITKEIGNKALDVPRMDTAILLYPTADSGLLRQMLGRLDRKLAGKKKIRIIAFDHSFVPSLARKRDAMVEAVQAVDPQARLFFVDCPEA